jgi:hypothetical protein
VIISTEINAATKNIVTSLNTNNAIHGRPKIFSRRLGGVACNVVPLIGETLDELVRVVVLTLPPFARTVVLWPFIVAGRGGTSRVEWTTNGTP